ncbi:hypothetical protein [Pseudomonas lopnurensis]|uniref:hypothetical protein n=1 Tax=Pseudomonas lopnurensis TaxID=1477517 RepID=UPI0028A69414|nr:hypothetical protein [Pseudomonas lopnurensis]
MNVLNVTMARKDKAATAARAHDSGPELESPETNNAVYILFGYLPLFRMAER